MRTVYQARTAELKQRLTKTVDLIFDRQYDQLTEFLGLRMLSEHNQAWARRHIIWMRDRWPEEKARLDELDQKVLRAKEKFERRRQAREEKKGLPAKTKRGSKSQTESVAPTPVGGKLAWNL
jgi:hypothetical protein